MKHSKRKNNLSWWSHDARSHEHWKFKVLVRKFGMAAEARFWRLNNLIAMADNCMLDISNDLKNCEIAAVLELEPAELHPFIDFLINGAKLIKSHETFIYTQDTQDDLGLSNKKREADAARIREKRQKEQEQENSVARDNPDVASDTLFVGTEKDSIGSDNRHTTLRNVTYKEDTNVSSPSGPSKKSGRKVDRGGGDPRSQGESERKEDAAEKKEKSSAKKEKRLRPDGEETQPFMKMFVAVWQETSHILYNENNPTKQLTIVQFKKAFPVSKVDMSNMRQIIVAIRSLCESTEHEWNQGYAQKAWKKFLNKARRDKWLKEHWILKNLNQNKDIILQNQQNGTEAHINSSKSGGRNEKPGTSVDRIQGLKNWGVGVSHSD